MATSIRQFNIGLYEEHLEEASFLYEQRLQLLDDPEVTWLDIGEFEERLEAHIDGLVVGEELAMEVCKRQAIEGDFGELFASLCVFCRQDRRDDVFEILSETDLDDVERLRAAGDALKYEMPDAWLTEWLRSFWTEAKETRAKLTGIRARIWGHRRAEAGAELVECLRAAPDVEHQGPVIWALGRLRDDQALGVLRGCLEHEDEDILRVTAVALLCLGDARTIDCCREQIRTAHWPSIPLALGGDRSAVDILLKRTHSGQANRETMMALGLLGDPSVIETLMECLKDQKLAENASIGLNVITGAELYEEAFIREQVDEDELFPEELERVRAGEEYTRPDGAPYGHEMTRPSQDRAEWEEWWSENKHRFDPEVRYRNGKPYSPRCLQESLEFDKTPHRVRQLACEELVIRYRANLAFETDMFVGRQRQALAHLGDWINAEGSRFKEGRWYFAGQEMR